MRRVNPEQERVICALYQQGKSLGEVSEEVGFGESTVRRVLEKNNIPRRTCGFTTTRLKIARAKNRCRLIKNARRYPVNTLDLCDEDIL